MRGGRVLGVAVAVAVVAAIALALATGARSSLGPVTTALRRTAAVSRCGASQFDARLRTLHHDWSGQTQALLLTNTGRTACRLAGAPRLTVIAADGRTVLRVPIVVADHRRAVVVEPGRTASVWLKLLAPQGIVAPGARQLLVRLHGVRGPLALRAPRADLSEQQLVVSYVASGSVSRLPGSTGLAPRCHRLGVVTVRDQLGAGAGHFDEAVELRNLERRSCSVRGFPRLSVTTMSGRELYGIPEARVGAAAAVDLAPGQVASAWADYPDCGALAGVTLAPEQELRERVSLAGVSAISGGLPEPTAWPTSRCVVSVAAIAAGSYRMAPGLTGIVHASR